MRVGRVQVFCRVKPTEAADRQHLCVLPDQCTVQVHRPPRLSGRQRPLTATANGSSSASASSGGLVVGTDSASAVTAASSPPAGSPAADGKPSPPPQCFTFDGVFYSDPNGSSEPQASGRAANTQENVYATAVRSLLTGDGVLGGTSAAVFCYGAAGTGKSFTMFGDPHHPTAESLGVAQRAVVDLYRDMEEISSYSEVARAIDQQRGAAEEEEDGSAFAVSMTVLQLQGERVTDMLAPGNETAPSTLLPAAAAAADKARRVYVSLDGKGEVVLKNVHRRRCRTADEAHACLSSGLHAHRASAHSQYGHLVVTFYIQQRNLSDGVAQTRQCVLHFVDLVGTQSQRSGGDRAVSADERHLARAVNQSLATLQQVALALGAASGLDDGDDDDGSAGRAAAAESGGRGRAHIPYRQSKLTTLLKGAMGGRCRTTLIAHIGGDPATLDATLSTLQFAKKFMRVVVDPQANVTMDTASQVRHLQRQLTDLRTELRLQAQLNAVALASAASPAVPFPASSSSPSGQSAAHPERQPQSLQGGGGLLPLSTDEMRLALDKVSAFVDGSTASLQVSNVREMQTCFGLLRSLIEQRDARVAELASEMAAVEAAAVAQLQELQHQARLLEVGGNGSFASARKSIDGGSVASTGSTRRGSARRRSLNGPAAAAGAKPPALSGAFAGSARGAGANGKAEVYTPSVLDTSMGVGYGASARANANANANALVAPAPPGSSTAARPATAAAPRATFAPSLPPRPPSAARLPPNPAQAADTAAPVAVSSTSSSTSASHPPPTATPVAALAAGGVGGKRPQTATVPGRPSPSAVLPTTSRPRPWSAAAVGPAHLSRDVPPPSPLSALPTGRPDPAKTAAFDAYKHTPVGAAQLQAMRADQAQLARLQQRAEALEGRLAEALVSLSQSSAADPLRPLTAASATSGCPPSSSSSSAVKAREPPQALTSMDGTNSAMRRLGGSHHALSEQIAAVRSEQAHLQQQLEHRHTGLLHNFEDWYRHRLWESGDTRYQPRLAVAVEHSPPPPPQRQLSAGSEAGATGRLPKMKRVGSPGKREGRAATPSPTASSAAAAAARPATATAAAAAAGGH